MKRTKRNTPSGASRKAIKNVSAQDALSMLESAVSYCQAAGIQIDATNGDDGTLGLFIPNAHYILTDDGTRATIRLGTVTARGNAPSIGTS